MWYCPSHVSVSRHRLIHFAVHPVKVFFLKAQLAGGSVSVDGRELEDHLWLTKEEMKDYVSQDYYKAVAPMLMH